MMPRFSAKYEETKKELLAFCEMFHQEKCEMTVLISVGVVGAALLFIILRYSNPGEGTGGLAFFFVKYICVWIAAFFAGDIAARTFLRKMMMSTAYGDAEELYRIRIKKRSEPLVVNVGFYEDRIVNDTGAKQAVYPYLNIKKILESDKAIGFLAKDGPGPKSFFAVPKESIADGAVEELKAYLLEQCVHVKKIKKI